MQSALALLFGGALVYVLCLVLAPWNFYFGGHFHYMPGWSGRGRLHDVRAGGGDYYLLVHFDPTIPGYRKSPLKGNAWLCTPKGEKFRLRFGGGMPRSHGTDLRGVPIHLYLNNWLTATPFGGSSAPSLEFYGSFGNSVLNMDDHGSLARAFRPDGTLWGPRDRNRPWKQESAHVTLEEDPSWISSLSCPAPSQ